MTFIDFDCCKYSTWKTVYTMEIKVMKFGTHLSRSDVSNKNIDWLCITETFFIIEVLQEPLTLAPSKCSS